MGMVDYIIIGIIAATTIVALIVILKKKKRGICCGDCSMCGMNCEKRK